LINNTLIELRNLLRNESKETGIIMSISGTVARVATKRGVISATLPTGAFLTGQTVRLQGEAILGRLKPVSDLPVYDV